MGPVATALVLYTGIAPHTTWPWLLLGQAALIVAGAVFINLWLRRSVFDPLRQLAEQVHHAAHSGIHPTIEPIRSSVLTPVSDAVVTISQELARSRRETHKAMACIRNPCGATLGTTRSHYPGSCGRFGPVQPVAPIVLFNDATQLLLGDDMSLGLGRSLTQLLKESAARGPCRAKDVKLQIWIQRSILEFACERSNPALRATTMPHVAHSYRERRLRRLCGDIKPSEKPADESLKHECSPDLESFDPSLRFQSV